MTAPKSSKARPTRGGKSHELDNTVEGDFPEPPEPEHPLPIVSGGTWAYSLGTDAHERGVYVQQRSDRPWKRVGPLPYVHQRLVTRRGDGTPDNAHYRVSATQVDNTDTGTLLISDDEVADGSWARRLGLRRSFDPKVQQASGTALLAIADEAEQIELTPTIDGDQLQLPPADVGPAGYGALAPVDETEARTIWQAIAAEAERAPKLAVILGGALGGLYTQALERQPHTIAAVGRGAVGKTTGVRLASTLVGNPTKVAKLLAGTPTGLYQELSNRYGMLPAFRDETDACPDLAQPEKANRFLLTINNGLSRTLGGKTGTERTSAEWRSVLVLAGNHSLVGLVANEGVHRRVVEIPPPITADAAQAKRFARELMPRGYGWPLHWLRERGLDVDGMAAMIEHAEQELPLPEESIAQGLGEHIAAAVAGAELLDELADSDGRFRRAAMTAGRQILDTLVRELADRGGNPGDRLADAITERITARPQSYVNQAEYVQYTTGKGGFPPRELEGLLLDGGKVAVLSGALRTIADQAGLGDWLVGLRELGDDGRLVLSNDAKSRLQHRSRFGGPRRLAYYLFQLDNDDSDDERDHEPTSDTPDSGPSPSGVSDPPRTDSDISDKYMTCENTPSVSDSPESVRGVRGVREETSRVCARVHAREGEQAPGGAVLIGQAGSVRLDEDATPTPCRVCDGGPVRTRDDQGPVHPVCAATAAPTGTPAQTTAEQPAHRQPGGQQHDTQSARLHLAGVLDQAGLWLPGADEPTPVELPADAGAAYRLAANYQLRQLWLHPNMHEPLGLPATRQYSAEVGPATAIEHAWTSVDGYRVDAGSGAGLAAWMNVSPTNDNQARRVAIAAPAYDWNRAAWHTAADGRTLLAALLRWADELGEPFYLSTNETTAALVRRTAKDKLTAPWQTRKQVPAPIGAVKHLGGDSRPLLDEEDLDDGWLHRYDLNGAEASVNTSVYIGIGEPEHVELGHFDRAAMKQRAGYVLANVPRQHSMLDRRLPNIIVPWTDLDDSPKTSGQPAWVPVETLVLLDELGVPIDPSEALLFPDSARLLRPYGERVSKALAALGRDEQDNSAQVARATLKTAYKSRIGDYNRVGARIFRPDARDAVIAKARANAYRTLRKIGEQSGRYPVAFHVDAAYYVSADPDPHGAAPAGMRFGTALGQWKHEASLPLSAVREYLGERGNFSAKFDKILDLDR